MLSIILGSVITIWIAVQYTNSDSLDSKSGWRKELYNIAAKEKIEIDDIYRIRASLRYYPQMSEEIIQFSFNGMSNIIIQLCEKYFKDLYRYNFNTLGDDESVRVICRYLLKIHWESRHRIVFLSKAVDLMDYKKNKPDIIGIQTVSLIMRNVSKAERVKRQMLEKIIEDELKKQISVDKKTSMTNTFYKGIIILSLSFLLICFGTLLCRIKKITLLANGVTIVIDDFLKWWFVIIVALVIIVIAVVSTIIGCKDVLGPKNTTEPQSAKDEHSST